MYGHWTHCNLIETICHGDLKIKPGKTSIHSIGYVHKSLFFIDESIDSAHIEHVHEIG